MLLCKDIEFACDEKVIRTLAFEEKRAYSQTLLDCSVNRHMIAACPLAFGEVDVKARIKSVLHYKKPAFWMVGGAMIVCTVTAICLLTNPPSSDVSDDTQSLDAQQSEVQILPINQPKHLSNESSQPPSSVSAVAAQAEWVWPTVSTDVSLPYGEHVRGAQTTFVDFISIRGEFGDDVYAAIDGQVVETANDMDYGRYIVISSEDGITTMYGQLNEVLVAPGSRVSAGDKIGTVGKSGMAVGTFLSFWVRDANGTVDPMKYYV